MGAFGKGKRGSLQPTGSKGKGGKWSDEAPSWSSSGNWSYKGKGSAKGWTEDGEAEEAGDPNEAPFGHVKSQYRMPRKLLAPYAGKTKSCLYAGSKTDDQFLAPKAFREELSSKNSEWHRPHRVAFAMSEFCGSTESLADLLQTLRCNHPTHEDLANMGAAPLQNLFDSAKGEKFLRATKALNYAVPKDLGSSEIREHTKTIVDFLQENGEQLHEPLVRLIISSSRMYVGAMQCLEAVATIGKLKHFGKQLPSKTDDPGYNGWRKKPGDVDAFAKFCSKMYKGLTEGKKFYAGGSNAASSVLGA